MLPYYLLVLTPTIAAALFQTKNPLATKRKNRLIMFLFFAIFLAVLICRDQSVGVDNKNYRVLFNSFSHLEYSEAFETEIEGGFVILSKIAFDMTGEYHTLMTLVAIVSVTPLAILYIKETEKPALTIALFMTITPFSMYFSGLRQVIAMAIGIIAYYFTKNKRLLLFLITVTVAMLFHSSAVVLFFMFPVYHLKIDHKKLIFAIPVLLVVFVFNKPIFKYLQTLFDDRYQYGNEETGAITMIVVFLVLLVICYFIPDEAKLDSQTKGLRSILVLVFMIQCFAPVNVVAMRMNYYYLIFIPILISRILTRAKEEYTQIAKTAEVLMFAFFIVYYFYKAHTGVDTLEIYPYEAYWK